MKNTFRLTRSARYVASRLSLMTIALLLVLLTGCGTVDPELEPESAPEAPPAPAPAPSIMMFSTEVALTDGGRGLQFFARADADVFYQRVTIVPPLPFRELSIDLGDTFVSEQQRIALQTEDIAYRKVAGTWSFAYEVRSGIGTKARNHTIRVTQEVTDGGASKMLLDVGEHASLLARVLR